MHTSNDNDNYMIMRLNCLIMQQEKKEEEKKCLQQTI